MIFTQILLANTSHMAPLNKEGAMLNPTTCSKEEEHRIFVTHSEAPFLKKHLSQQEKTN